jgi:predicted metalloprotease
VAAPHVHLVVQHPKERLARVDPVAVEQAEITLAHQAMELMDSAAAAAAHKLEQVEKVEVEL